MIDLNQHAFLVLKELTPTFSNLGMLLKIDIKYYPLLGKLLSVWRTVSVLPKPARSAQMLKTHIAFSMFPILDTNLCCALTFFQVDKVKAIAAQTVNCALVQRSCSLDATSFTSPIKVEGKRHSNII